MHLKLPVYVISVSHFLSYLAKNPQNRIFLYRIFGENLKISIFPAKICIFFSLQYCDVKGRATGTFWYQ